MREQKGNQKETNSTKVALFYGGGGGGGGVCRWGGAWESVKEAIVCLVMLHGILPETEI